MISCKGLESAISKNFAVVDALPTLTAWLSKLLWEIPPQSGHNAVTTLQAIKTIS